jgi:hypothetical protein
LARVSGQLQVSSDGRPFDVFASALVSTTPPNLAHLPFWLDGFDIDLHGNTTLTGGQAVQTWKNKGSQAAGNDVTQATGNLQALFSTGGINGRPALLFAANKIYSGPLRPVAISAPRHIFLVMTVGASISSGFILYSGSTFSEGYAVTAGVGISPTTVVYNLNGTNSVQSLPDWTAGNVLVEFGFDGVTAHLPTFTRNGVPGVVTQNNGTGGIGAETGSAGVSIGFQHQSFIGECLWYDTIQSTAVVAAARAYLSSKWGIAA